MPSIEFKDEVKDLSLSEKKKLLATLEEQIAYVKEHLVDIPTIKRQKGLDEDAREVLNYLINKANSGSSATCSFSSICSSLGFDDHALAGIIGYLVGRDYVIQFSQGRVSCYAVNKTAVRSKLCQA